MRLIKLLILSLTFFATFTACSSPEKKEDERFGPTPGGKCDNKEAEY